MFRNTARALSNARTAPAFFTTHLLRRIHTARLTVNGRQYALPKSNAPIVGICVDGCSRDYIDAAMAAGMMPNLLASLARPVPGRAVLGTVDTIVPTFTNPNNVAIVTGTPPEVNGICGNYFIDEAGREVMMNDPSFLRVPTLLAAMSDAGVRVVVLTAKDKLLRLLSKGMNNTTGIAVSVEKCNEADSVASLSASLGVSGGLQGLMGATAPTIYQPNISIYLVEAGARILRKLKEGGKSERTLLYLSTTDYVQHKYAPGSEGANDFYRQLDNAIGMLEREGAVVGFTADHGMNSKADAQGRPNAVYLETVLAEKGLANRTILPITDPYVVHHGALGSYATVHLQDASPANVERALSIARAQPGIQLALTRDEAARLFRLPRDRIGDLVVVAGRNAVIGRTVEYHDMTGVDNLRSHGGLEESRVPLYVSHPLRDDYAKRLFGSQAKNWDLYDFLCNGVRDF